MASHQKYNILYGRLSQEDARMGDSNSIVNQRRFLEKFAQDNGFENTLFLADESGILGPSQKVLKKEAFF